MLSHRLQILVDADLRRRLDAEAERRGSSVGSVVRDALDAQLGGGGRREQRVRAVEEMAGAAAGKRPSIEAMHEILDDERGAGSPRSGP